MLCQCISSVLSVEFSGVLDLGLERWLVGVGYRHEKDHSRQSPGYRARTGKYLTFFFFACFSLTGIVGFEKCYS